ncbi:type II toxin-antitoxin system RelE/ParE family toxin [Candidatus Woesearchaeota archaeon]|nr:type II toxin-antitoxin system RelE/ParE family toxin [Candidatus Woesearchaeota archaeon]
MTYSVEWHPKVRKFLRKLPEEMSARIVLKVKESAGDPFRYLEHYEGKDHYKLRVGDYRLLIDVDFKNKVLLVQVAGHRGNIYKHPQ